MAKKLSLDESYGILGLNRDCNEDDIRRAYKKLALKTHPDKNPDDPDASAKFRKVSEAYKRLTEENNEDDEYDDEDDYYDDDGFDFDFEGEGEFDEEFEFCHKFKRGAHTARDFFDYVLYREILKSRFGARFQFGGGRATHFSPFGHQPSFTSYEADEDEYEYIRDIPIFRFIKYHSNHHRFSVTIKSDIYNYINKWINNIQIIIIIIIIVSKNLIMNSVVFNKLDVYKFAEDENVHDLKIALNQGNKWWWW